MDLLAREECQGATGQRVRGVCREIQESSETKDCRVHLVCQDKKESQVTSSPPTVLERKEHWDCPDCQEILEFQEAPGCKVHSVLQDLEATRVVQVLPVLLDQRETWD